MSSNDISKNMTRHPVVGLFRKLLPKASFCGGSVSRLLPDVRSIPAIQRPHALSLAVRKGREHCIKSMFSIRHIRSKIPRHGSGGELIWPNGYCGSLTHKGTIIIGAIAKKKQYKSIGIDLELYSNADVLLDQKTICPEGGPQINEKHSILLAQSAKEAFFKAQYPITGIKLDYRDVSIDWDTANNQFSPYCKNIKMNHSHWTGNWHIHENWILTAVSGI